MSTPRDSTPRSELERVAWPRLAPELVDVLRDEGREWEPTAGAVLFAVGQDTYDFMLIERGSIDIVDPRDGAVVVNIAAPNFMGELGLLLGQGTFLSGVAAEDCRVISLSPDALRRVIATVPELSDAIVSAFSARRRLLIEWNEGGLTIVGRENDAATARLREFVDRSRIPHRFIDRADTAAVAALDLDDLPADGALALSGAAGVIPDATPRRVARALGLDLAVGDDEVFDLIIVGAGPAGLAASVYGASEGLRTLAIEDTAIGGQAGTSSRIENYLGFMTGISGAELAYRGEIQAAKFGARLAVPRRATGICRVGEHLMVELDDGCTMRGRAVVLANGVRYRRLPLDGLRVLEGRGVYYAATELEARACSGQEIVIVGGANSAGQAAMFLSRTAARTHLVVRRADLGESMSSYLSARIVNDPRIRLWTESEVVAVHGESALDGVTIRSGPDGRETHVPARALFIMIGAAPNTGWLDGFVDLDEKGFITTGAAGDPYATSQPGVYAVGDIRSGSVKRVASAVGEGSVVVSAVHGFLNPPDG